VLQRTRGWTKQTPIQIHCETTCFREQKDEQNKLQYNCIEKPRAWGGTHCNWFWSFLVPGSSWFHYVVVLQFALFMVLFLKHMVSLCICIGVSFVQGLVPSSTWFHYVLVLRVCFVHPVVPSSTWFLYIWKFYSFNVYSRSGGKTTTSNIQIREYIKQTPLQMHSEITCFKWTSQEDEQSICIVKPRASENKTMSKINSNPNTVKKRKKTTKMRIWLDADCFLWTFL
jgi:hypothetical protein